MRAERLFRALGLVDPALVEEALAARRRAVPWRRWGALAACLALVIGFGWLAAARTAARPAAIPPLPGVPAAREKTAAAAPAAWETELPFYPMPGRYCPCPQWRRRRD